MKKNNLFIIQNLLLVVFIAFTFGCSPKLSATWTKEGFNDRGFSKIAVIGISENLQARTAFEQTATSYFKKQGINAVEGIRFFPPDMTEEQQKIDNLIKIIQDNQLDGVITMSLVDTEESERYEPGENVTFPAGYYRLGKYIVRRYATVRTPGYYVPTKSYLIEAVLYNLKGELVEGKETIVWRGQSALVDPTSIESAAKSYSKKMVQQMIEDEIVKAK